MKAERVIKQQVAREVHQLTTKAGFCCEVLRCWMSRPFCDTTSDRESSDAPASGRNCPELEQASTC